MVRTSHRRAHEVRGGTYQEPVKNRILAALPAEEYERLFPHLEFVALKIQASRVRTECADAARLFPEQRDDMCNRGHARWSQRRGGSHWQ